MADDSQLPESREGTPDQQPRDGSSRGHSANEYRRQEETEDGKPDVGSSSATQATFEQESIDDLVPTEAEVIQERKPWETLVIGNLGENLSYIEEKDRAIEQQRYIVRYHQENSPHEVAHNQRILENLIQERLELADNEENNMPQDKREEKSRIGERLDSLNWALDTCQCGDEEVNIRAAIQGYQSGEIPYSNNFTLIYGGHIVDICPSYQSFCIDRQERLDRYFARYGPGWLWQEPPLSGPGFEAMANKALCLTQNANRHNYFFGTYAVNMKFAVDKKLVMRKTPTGFVQGDQGWLPNTEVSCCFETLLDSGATFPSLLLSDLQRLNIDLRYYAAQGVTRIRTVSDIQDRRHFEMRVSVCSMDGASLVGEGDQAVWPNEPHYLGGFVPVWINENIVGPANSRNRLSGMIPFESCYIGSAPTTKELWLGEDRRDVLGARRMPSLLRYDTARQLGLVYPKHFHNLRAEAKTPDQVVFIHSLDPAKGQGSAFVDADRSGTRSQGHRSTQKGSLPGQQHCARRLRKILVAADPPIGSRWKRSIKKRKKKFLARLYGDTN
ncbi:hypothetical protein F4811DRAFT_564174 [Daldinia bambusicola]|nr:hypothetical protein F4811DRAFT_564174 [Daldinia bambusicola]